MKKNFIFLGSFLLVILSIEVQGQQVGNPEFTNSSFPFYDKFFGGGPIVSTPLSNRDFIDKQSVKGIRFFYRELINNRVSAGFDFSYITYNDYLPPKVYDDGTQAIYTDIYNNLDQYAITVSGEYNFRPDARLMPFVGLGAGAAYSSINLYYNIYSDSDRKWSGLVRPYGGAIFRFSSKSSWAAISTLSFDHAMLKLPDYDYNGFSALNLQVGLVFLDW